MDAPGLRSRRSTHAEDDIDNIVASGGRAGDRRRQAHPRPPHHLGHGGQRRRTDVPAHGLPGDPVTLVGNPDRRPDEYSMWVAAVIFPDGTEVNVRNNP